MKVRGKYALVTGSSRGIGRGIAVKLAENGINVAINYVKNEAAANETLQKIRDLGSDGFTAQADVTNEGDIDRLFERAASEFGELDIFVNNALGDLFAFYRNPMEITGEQFEMAVAAQPKAFLLGCQRASRLMKEGGRIVAVSVIEGHRSGSWQPYVAMGSAKANLDSVCRYMAVALAKQGITVNAVRPGWIEDSVLNLLPEEAQNGIRAWSREWTPMGRIGTHDDIGNAVALLCSEEAGWITGQILGVDGGASLMSSVAPPEIQRG